MGGHRPIYPVTTALLPRLLRKVDVEVVPGMNEVIHVLLVARYPGGDDGVGDAKRLWAPGIVGRDDDGHLRINIGPLFGVGDVLALAVQCVEIRIREASESRSSR